MFEYLIHQIKGTLPRARGDYAMLGALVFLVGIGVTSFGQPNTPMVEYEWTAPTTGSPVLYYRGQREVTPDGGTMYAVDLDSIPAAPDGNPTSFMSTYQWGATVRLRVAGVDASGRQGDWSPWSVLWVDQGAPGAPGVPSQTLVIQ